MMRRNFSMTLMLAGLTLGGCARSDLPPEPRTPEGTSAEPAAARPSEQISTFYAACWRRFNDRAWDELSKCYSDPVTSGALGDTSSATALERMLERGVKGHAAAFPDGTGEPQLTLINGDRIVAIVLLRGTHTEAWAGPMGLIPPTGKKVGFLALHGAELNKSGRMSGQWWMVDTPLVMAQLGLSPAPSRPVMEQGFVGKPVVIAANDPTERKNIEAVRRVYALFNSKDKGMFEHFADDIIEMNPSDPKDTVGRPSLAAINQAYWTAFSDIRVDIDDVWAAGDYTVMVAHFRGTNDGEMPALGLNRSGRKLDAVFAEIVRWDGGKMKVTYPFLDSMQIAMQLGLTETKEQGKR